MNVLEKIKSLNKDFKILTKDFISTRKTPIIEFECKNGHKTKTSYKNICTNNYKLRCSTCDSCRYDFDKLQNIIKDKNSRLNLLELDGTYLKIECAKHGTFKANKYSTINKSTFICSECGKEHHLKNKRQNEIDKLKKFLPSNISFCEEDYVKQSKKMRFECSEHGEFFKSVNKMYTNHSFCPICSKYTSNGEVFFSDMLKNNDIKFETQKIFNDCKNKKHLKFNFYIEEFNTLIEIDGKQHFNKNSKYFNEELIENDKIKDEYCKNNNIRLIRIKYPRMDKKFKEECNKIIIDLKSSTTIPYGSTSQAIGDGSGEILEIV